MMANIEVCLVIFKSNIIYFVSFQVNCPYQHHKGLVQLVSPPSDLGLRSRVIALWSGGAVSAPVGQGPRGDPLWNNIWYTCYFHIQQFVFQVFKPKILRQNNLWNKTCQMQYLPNRSLILEGRLWNINSWLQWKSKKEKKSGRQKKRWEDNIKEWTGMDFASSTRAAENRSRWKGIVANSSVVPRRPPKVMG